MIISDSGAFFFSSFYVNELYLLSCMLGKISSAFNQKYLTVQKGQCSISSCNASFIYHQTIYLASLPTPCERRNDITSICFRVSSGIHTVSNNLAS